MRVGVLHGGAEHATEQSIPPSQRLRVVRAGESDPYASSTAVEDGDEDTDDTLNVRARKNSRGKVEGEKEARDGNAVAVKSRCTAMLDKGSYA